MATVPHVSAWAGCTKYQVDGFLYFWVYKGEKNGPRIHNEKETNNSSILSGSFKENFYMKQVVIYLLRICIIDGIPQISASCARMAFLEVMGVRPNVHWMAQNWNTA